MRWKRCEEVLCFATADHNQIGPLVNRKRSGIFTNASVCNSLRHCQPYRAGVARILAELGLPLRLIGRDCSLAMFRWADLLLGQTLNWPERCVLLRVHNDREHKVLLRGNDSPCENEAGEQYREY